jgi:hypothetical protein
MVPESSSVVSRPKVMAPRQSSETRNPVLPNILYFHASRVIDEQVFRQNGGTGEGDSSFQAEDDAECECIGDRPGITGTGRVTTGHGRLDGGIDEQLMSLRFLDSAVLDSSGFIDGEDKNDCALQAHSPGQGGDIRV